MSRQRKAWIAARCGINSTARIELKPSIIYCFTSFWIPIIAAIRAITYS